jgi:ATP-binding cassette subfamily F protein uup
MHIRALALGKSFGSRTLFENLSFSFHPGEHIGLIGPNGSGKSTLLRILARLEELDSGSVDGNQTLRIAYLPQEDQLAPEPTLEECLLAVLAESSLQEHEQLTRVRVMLGKVGFTDFSQRTGALSGGWRKRLAIARELVKEPDLLLLDEPSNHLDLAGILWLERLLQKTGTGFMLVSHDRYLLESVTDRIIEINPKYPEGYLSFPGCYSDFLEQRLAWFEMQEKREQALSSQVRLEVAWLRRGPQARRTKAKGRIQTAHEKINSLSDLRSRNRQGGRMEADFAATRRKTNDLIVTQGLNKSLGGNSLFCKLDFTLSPGTCLGVVGNNGTGKTTLIRTLVGDIEPDAGTIKRAQELKVAWFDQRREQLDRSLTLQQALSPNGDLIRIGDRTVHVVSWAQDFLFRADQLDQPVGSLSGGEQARVLMATLMRQPADLLFLDEPTNDLDIDSIEVLEEKLAAFPGAVVLITHDRAMLDRICTTIVGLHGGGESRLYASLDQWEAAEERLVEKAPAPLPRSSSSPAAAPSASGFSREEQRELERLARLIPKAEEIVAGLHAQQEDPALCNDHKRLHELYSQIADAQAEVDRLYGRWMELEEKRNGKQGTGGPGD